MKDRSRQMIEVSYYFSRFGTDKPPSRFNTSKWNVAYRMFYLALNGGRGVIHFERSLKGQRDTFDGHFEENNRQGWKESDKTPVKLKGLALDVYKNFSIKDEVYIWNLISKHADLSSQLTPEIFEDLISEDTANSDDDSTYAEGKLKVYISKTAERNPKLRQKALEIHGYICQACGFDFEQVYGPWGRKFAEVHNMQLLSEFKGISHFVNARTDLRVLCANCHRMVHRKKGITLTVEELKLKIRR